MDELGPGLRHAGFPSPAEGYTEAPLDLNRLLVKRPAATMFVQMSGDAMEGEGIRDGDILVVDRSLAARAGRIVVAAVDGEYVLRKLVRHGDRAALEAADGGKTPPVELRGEEELRIFGVVTASVRRMA